MKMDNSEHENNMVESSEVPKCCFLFSSSNTRFLVLIYLIAANFCLAISYDMPASLASEIERAFSIGTYQYELLYSLYCVPYIFLGLFGGILVDRILGVKVASILFILICLLGQIVITLGAYTKIYWIMLLGRFFYGIGGESMQIILMYYSVMWFAGKEINFVFGVLQSIGRMGSSLVFLIAYPLYKFAEIHSPRGTQLGATVSLGIGVITAVLLLIFLITWESKRNNKFKNNKIKKDEYSVNFRDIVTFPLKFWLVITITCANTTAVFVYVSCSQGLLMSKFHYTAALANSFGSTFNIIGAAVSPFPGILVDRIGYSLYFILFGFLLGIVAQIILAFTLWNPYIPIALFAVSFSTLSACTLPMTSLVVKSYQVGTAYGVFLSILNLCISCCTILVGYLLDKYGYFLPVLFYLSILLVGLISTILLWIIDRKENGFLNLPAKSKQAILQSIE